MMKTSYRGAGPYRGVVKDEGGKVVAECEHWHHNRDGSSMTWGESARSCAKRLLEQVDPASHEASLPAYMKEQR